MEFALPWQDQPAIDGIADLEGEIGADSPRETLERLCQLIPERFEFWFRQLVQATARRPDPEQLIFVNAWNEWAEGNHLEPDQRWGSAYLEATARVAAEARADA